MTELSPHFFGFDRLPDGTARFGGIPLQTILEEAQVGTPAYIYDLGAIRNGLGQLEAAFAGHPHLLAYAVKANSAGAIVRAVRDAGAGIDAVSGGELLLARRAGIPAERIVLSGVAKRNDEIDLALTEGIQAIQAESPDEVQRILDRAKALGLKGRISLRMNPSVEIDSHAHISTGHDKAKFGILFHQIAEVAAPLLDHAHGRLVGLSSHVGSMLRATGGYVSAAQVVCEQALLARKAGHRLEYVDFGGGFGIDYGGAPAEAPSAFVQAALGLLRAQGLGDLKLVIEPGRSIVGPYGALVARVIGTKLSGKKRWLFVDAGMNDLMRPALYGARHRIESLTSPPEGDVYQVAGPVCESTDDFGEFTIGPVPEAVVIRDAGAYGFAMACEYNGRPLPSEVFVEGGKVVHTVRAATALDWVQGRLR